jgi:hypothetical protein
LRNLAVAVLAAVWRRPPPGRRPAEHRAPDNKQMLNIILRPDERRDVIAYILSLK